MKRTVTSGFTLVEIMMAMALFGFIFGTIFYIVMSGLNSRTEAIHLNQAVILAKNKMDEIRSLKFEEATEEGEFKNSPQYKFQYFIREEEKDLLSGQTLDVNSSSTPSEKKTNVRDTATLSIITVLHYQVSVKHSSGLTYNLNFYRNTGKSIK